MKILKIRLKNLNSLAGEWEIDLVHRHYTEDGLFVISGKTGSGKTTILDAICLALYGDTPRLTDAKGLTLGQEIMTYGQVDCFSEVTFQTAEGKRWRCRWSQSRVGNKPTGNLRPCERQLVDDVTNIPEETGIKNVGRRIEEITGMTFEQFTRSVMLAQGRFGDFLDAKNKERVELLEQLAGTDKYREISKRVYSRYITAKDTLDHLREEAQKWLQPKDADWEKQSRAQLEATESDIKKSEAQKDKALADERWRDDLDKLEKDVSLLAKSRDEICKRLDEFEPARLRLEAAKGCMALNPLYEKQNETKSEYDKCEKTLLEAQRKHKDALVKCEQVKSELDSARTVRDQSRKRYSEELETLEQASKLDNELKQLRDRRTELLEVDKKENAFFSKCQELLRNYRETLVEKASFVRKQLKNDAEFDRILEEGIAIECSVVQQLNADKSREEANAKSFQDELVMIRTRASLESHRSRLKPGEACPLCGALEHPYANEETPVKDEVENRLNESLDRLQTITSQITQTENRILAYTRDRQEIESDRLRFHSVLEENASWLSSKTLSPGEESPEESVIVESLFPAGNATTNPDEDGRDEPEASGTGDAFPWNETYVSETSANSARYSVEEMPTLRKVWQDGRTAGKGIEVEIATLVANIKNQMTEYARLKDVVDQSAKSLQYFELEIQEKEKQRYERFQNMNPVTRKKELSDDVKEAEEKFDICQERQAGVSATENALRIQIEQLQNDLIVWKTKQDDAASRFACELEKSTFANTDEYLNARMPDEEYTQLGIVRDRLDNERRTVDSQFQIKETEMEEKRCQERTTCSLEECRALTRKLNTDYTKLIETRTRLFQELEENDKMKQKAQAQNELIDKQQVEYDRWLRLKNLIGSKEGDLFSRFAQKLTFRVLLALASEYLSSMTNRYCLVPSGSDGLDFSVRDDCQANQRRSVKNVSGGERFMVCLSLALGLSRMASCKTRVDSLFLDEGFGTLDDDSLATALDALGALRESGKLVGVISHVKTVRDSIATEIVVESDGSGISKISGPGVRRVS